MPPQPTAQPRANESQQPTPATVGPATSSRVSPQSSPAPPPEQKPAKPEIAEYLGPLMGTVDQLADLFGIGGLVTVVKSAIGYLSDFSIAVERAARPAKSREMPESSGMQSGLPRFTSPADKPLEPTKSSAGPSDIIEFASKEISGPKPTATVGTAKQVAHHAVGTSATTGAATTGAAGASAAGGAAGGAGAMAGLAAAAGPAAIAVAAVGGAAIATIAGIKKFADVVEKTADEIESYSIDVSLAQAKNELRQEMAIMRRAEQIGPQIAQWEEWRGEMAESFADLKTAALEGMLELAEMLRPFLERIPEAIDLSKEQFEVIVLQLRVLVEIATGQLPQALTTITQLPKEMADVHVAFAKLIANTGDDSDEWLEDPFIDQFLNPNLPGGRKGKNVAPGVAGLAGAAAGAIGAP